MKFMSFFCYSMLCMTCTGQNDTNILQHILNNVKSDILENTNRTRSSEKGLGNIKKGISVNYQQMLDNVRSAIKEFHAPVNLSSLVKTAEIVDDLTQIISMQQLLDAMYNVTNNGDVSGSPSPNSTVPTASPQASLKCVTDFNSIYVGLTQGKDWAFRMLDAAAKPPPGLMNSKFVWLGDYEECVSVKPENFKGQYCLSTTYIVSVENPMTHKQGMRLHLGYCIPDSCSKDDGLIVMNSVVSRLTNKQVQVRDLHCQEPDKPYDTWAIISLSVIGVFILIMSIATGYDVIITHFLKPKENRANIYKINISDNDKSKNAGIKFEPEQKDRESGILGKLILSFSVYTNASKLLSTKQGAGTLTAINGLRFISMTWTILAHTCATGLLNGGVENAVTWYPKFMIQWYLMSVDTFFALSGTLLTYLVLKQLKKEKGKINWFLFYFHRFWRLTPPYMLTMMVYVPLYPYLGSGPFWKKDGHGTNYCKESWWYNLLYINNFRDVLKQCMPWTWYLANDMQFYVISPLILLPMFFSKIAGLVVSGSFLVAAMVIPAVISKPPDETRLDTSFNWEYKMNIGDFSAEQDSHSRGHYSNIRPKGKILFFNDGAYRKLRWLLLSGIVYFSEYYQRPYCRMGPYVVGMMTGYLLYRKNCRCKVNRYLNLVLWAIFAALACLVFYGLYDDYNGNPMSSDVAALYNAVHRTIWGSSVCWVIFSCATGNGGFINTLLSWKVFVPLGRLTYCAYLIHPIIQYYFYDTRKQLRYWDEHSVIYEYLAHLVLSYLAAFVLFLAFESPMMGLEKIMLRRDRKTKINVETTKL